MPSVNSGIAKIDEVVVVPAIKLFYHYDYDYDYICHIRDYGQLTDLISDRSRWR